MITVLAALAVSIALTGAFVAADEWYRRWHRRAVHRTAARRLKSARALREYRARMEEMRESYDRLNAAFASIGIAAREAAMNISAAFNTIFASKG